MMLCESCERPERIESMIKVTDKGVFCMKCINSGIYKTSKEQRVSTVEYWDKVHDSYLKKYNITSKEFNDFYHKQNGACGICKIPQNKLKKALYVDHCHTTGKVRGLLCGHCNFLLGHAKDNIAILAEAIKYLS